MNHRLGLRHPHSLRCTSVDVGTKEKWKLFRALPLPVIYCFKASSVDEGPRALGAVTISEDLHDRMHQSLADVSPTVVVLISDMLHEVVLSILEVRKG